MSEFPGAPGGWEELRASLIGACESARAAGDPDRFAAAALALPSIQGFGVHPGRIPALLHEAYLAAEGCPQVTRARLGAALARAWVYGGEPGRARRFADESVALASETGDSTVIAESLDAALLVRWGPDDYDERRRLAARLADVTAHVTDSELQLSAHLWRLTTAWECLDLVAVQRQMRALDMLADESGSSRVAFFALSRRAMYALTIGDLITAEELMARTRDVGRRLAEPDVIAVTHELSATLARHRGDLATLAEEAQAFEDFGRGEGIASVSAEAAVYFAAAGRLDKAESIARLVVGDGLAGLARDVDFLLTITSVVRVSTALGLDEITRDGVRLIEPYAGRAVLNAGAVSFGGVVDEYLYRAHRSLGEVDPIRWRDFAVSAYRRIGASWWLEQLDGGPGTGTDQPDRTATGTKRDGRAAAEPRVRTIRFHRQQTGLWSVGAETEFVAFPDLRGFHYLRQLLARPGIDVGSLELSELAEGHPGVGIHQPDLGQVLDARAKAAYRSRLQDLDRQIGRAEARGDPVRYEQAETERQALIRELAAAAGVGGRSRRVGANDERARIAVRRAITTALSRIEQHDRALARLLRDTIRTGASCRYDPDPQRPVQWLLDQASKPS